MTENKTRVRLFAVNEKPCAVWYYTKKDYERFLDMIEPYYFAFQVELLKPQLQGEHKQLAATSLRSVYAHALETFIALNLAVLQAPNCVEGWLLKYKNQDLYELNDRLLSGKAFWTKPTLPAYDWKSAVETIYRTVKYDDLHLVTEWYNYFSIDFGNAKRQAEYNSVKHGLRALSTPFRMIIGPVESDADGITFESDFGIGFHEIERLVPEDNINFHIDYHRLNWSDTHVAESTVMLSMLMTNLVSCIRGLLGLNMTPMYFLREELRVSAVLSRTDTAPDFASRTRILSGGIPDLVSKQEVEDSYKERQ